jgi:hypothetical protein
MTAEVTRSESGWAGNEVAKGRRKNALYLEHDPGNVQNPRKNRDTVKRGGETARILGGLGFC